MAALTRVGQMCHMYNANVFAMHLSRSLEINICSRLPNIIRLD